MYSCRNCEGYFHHDDAPPTEIDGHLVCPECVCGWCGGKDSEGCTRCSGTGMGPLDEEE